MIELAINNLGFAIEDKPILHDISFALKQKELVIMLGPNGAGKTMALRAAMGLVKNAAGSACLTMGENKVETKNLDPVLRARHISYLPQIRPLAWPSQVGDIIALGLFAYEVTPGRLTPEDQQKVDNAMASCGISHLAKRNADTLSGGELARVHCARGFVAQAPLLIADEPVSALDPYHQYQIMDLFKAQVKTGSGALIILHDINLAARYGDRLIWLKDGHIDADGSVKDTLTAKRLADIYGIDAQIDGDKIHISGVI